MHLDEGVNIDCIKKKYTSDHHIDIHVRTFTNIMNKATYMLPYISMKFSRKKVDQDILCIITLLLVLLVICQLTYPLIRPLVLTHTITHQSLHNPL